MKVMHSEDDRASGKLKEGPACLVGVGNHIVAQEKLLVTCKIHICYPTGECVTKKSSCSEPYSPPKASPCA